MIHDGNNRKQVVLDWSMYTVNTVDEDRTQGCPTDADADRVLSSYCLQRAVDAALP